MYDAETRARLNGTCDPGAVPAEWLPGGPHAVDLGATLPLARERAGEQSLVGIEIRPMPPSAQIDLRMPEIWVSYSFRFEHGEVLVDYEGMHPFRHGLPAARRQVPFPRCPLARVLGADPRISRQRMIEVVYEMRRVPMWIVTANLDSVAIDDTTCTVTE